MKTAAFLSLVLALVSSDQVSVQKFTNANNLLFTPAIYRELVKNNEGNFLVSPFSVETAVAFILLGSRGKSAEETRKALGFSDDNAKIKAAVKSLLHIMKGNELYYLQTANKMYVHNSYPIRDDFNKTVTEVFQADSENIDFTQKEKSVKTMNSWVEKHTENKIHDLVKTDDPIDPIKASLINTLYFKANWVKKNSLYKIAKGNFYQSSEDVVEAPHIYENYFNYCECPHLNAKFVELPFQGGDASMTIILPNDKEGLAALEKQIDKVFLPRNFTTTFVDIAIPRFKIETEIDFKKILQNLGVQESFESSQGDLSGMFYTKGWVTMYWQNTFIAVSEEGVEAAAATSISPSIEPPPKQLIADHPFIFYIKVKDVIIFLGRVISPSQ